MMLRQHTAADRLLSSRESAVYVHKIHRLQVHSLRQQEQQPQRTMPCRPAAGGQADPQLISATSRRTVLAGTAGVFCCSACGGRDAQAGVSGSKGSWPGRWGWYDRYFAFAMATTMQQYEAEVAPLKRRLFSAAVAPGARILELGMGTGPNLVYYAGQQDVHVTGVDANQEMTPYALEAAAIAGLPADRLRLVTGDAQALPLEDDSFDLVVCTLVLCSVPDVQATLREAARVLRPGGRFLFIEHVLAAPQRWDLRLQQRLLDPLQRLAADNCHLTRDTGVLLRTSSLFSQVDMEPEFEVSGQGLIAPHIAGTATV